MQRQRIPMTIEDYHLLEQPFGYKVEYWDGHTVITPRDNLREHADTSIKRYFAGKRGEPHPASVMVLAEDGSISGIALLLTDEEGEVCLDLLYVVPNYQRQHIATQMVATAVNSLHAAGIATLTSTYHICNEDSRRWHHAFGFVDAYDQMYIRLKYAWYRNEIWRREKLGLTEGLDALVAERDCWYAQLDEMWRY